VSFCFADKSLARKLGSKATELSRIYSEQATRAGKKAYEIGQGISMRPADLTATFMSTATGMQDEIAGNCTKIESLIDKWGATCKQLVEHPELRLKQLSECQNQGKVGC
jgi:hypothetical protein